MRLIQCRHDGRLTVGLVVDAGSVQVVAAEEGVYGLARQAIAEGRPLSEVVAAALTETRLDYAALVDNGELLPPLTHPDPAHWLVTGLPLIFIAPILAVLLHLNENSYGALMLTLLLGTPVLSLLGAIGVALTVGIKKGGVLLSLLVLPLYIPVLIFATSAIDTAAMNLPYSGQLAIIAALFFGSLTLAPFAVASALKVSTN